MTRLLLLITDLERGGTPTVVRELALRLRSPTTQVEVACLKSMGPIGNELRAAGIDVIAFDATRPTQLFRAARRLVDLVRHRQIDTVLSFLVHANVVAARAAKRLPDVRWFQSIQTTQRRPRWHWWAQRFAGRHAQRIIVPSESVARCAIERSGIPRSKIAVIPNAIEVDHFLGTGDLHAISPLEDARTTKRRVGFVGRLDPVKRVPTLVAAMSHLPADVTLSIYGDGVERAAIERAVAANGLSSRVTLHGTIADPREAYANIDVLVLPSEAEGFGLVLIEAMAAGVPVVATNVDGIRDVVSDGETGLLVPVGDPAALARAIERVLNDATLRASLIENGRRDVAERFAWDAVIERYRATLLVSSPRNQGAGAQGRPSRTR